MSKKIELAANVLIIIVALLVGGGLVQKYLLSGTPPPANNQAARLQPVVGTKIDLPDVNWSQRQKTLILALQTNCGYCNQSVPFYKRIIESVSSRNIKLFAVFPTEKEESAAHLSELGLMNIEVKQSPLSGIQVMGTPTLILTNDKGEVTDFWVGKLSPDMETEVINKLNSQEEKKL